MNKVRDEAVESISTPRQGDFEIGINIMQNVLKKKVIKKEEEAIQVDDDDSLIEFILKVDEKRRVERNKSIFSNQVQISDEKCDWVHEKASLHAEASKFNLTTPEKQPKLPDEDMCKCGCGKGRGESLPFCEDETKQFFFGPGIILFFFYLKRIILLIFCVSLVYAVYSLTTNVLNADWNFQACQTSPGTLQFLCEYKFLSAGINKNQHEGLIHVDVWLGFLFCFIWIVALRIIRTQGRNLNQKIDHYLESSSDYCIEVDNLPYGEFVEGELLKHLLLLWKKARKSDEEEEPLIVKSVQTIYKMTEPRKLIEDIITTASLMTSYLEKKENNYHIKQEFMEQFVQKKTELILTLEDLENFRERFIKDSKFRRQYATNTALVEFADSDQQTEFVRRLGSFRTTIFGEIKQKIYDSCFRNEESSELFKGNQLRIIRAPEPSDIHWSNCEKDFSYYRVILVWLITFGIVGVSFGVLLLIKELKSIFQFLNNLSILISISLQLFNRLIWIVLIKLIGLEQNNTKTDNIISIMTKSIMAQTINVIVLPIIMNLVLDTNLDGAEGLIGLALDYQFIVLLMMMNLNLINVPYQLKRLSLCIPCIRNFIIRYYSSPVGELDSFDEIREVLNYYEPPAFPIAGAYVYITTVIFQAIFFCYAQPTLLFFLIFNIGCFIIVQKYLLLQRCKIPQLIDFLIFETCISIMHYVPLIYGCGSLMFISVMNEKTDFSFYVPSCLCILLTLFSKQNPKKIFNSLNRFLMDCCASQPEVFQLKAEVQANTSKNVLLKNIARNSFIQNKFSERRECYYKSSNTRVLLNYENKLTQITDPGYMSRNREFCERFSVNLTKLDAYQLKKKSPPEKVNFENIISIPILKKNNKKDNIEGKESNFFKQARN